MRGENIDPAQQPNDLVRSLIKS